MRYAQPEDEFTRLERWEMMLVNGLCRDEESKNTHIVSDIAVKKWHLQAADGLYGLWWPVWNHFLSEKHEVSHTEPLKNMWLT